MGLIDTLFSECVGYLELRAISPSYRRNEFFRLSDTHGIKGFIAANKKHELYFAVATRDGGGGKRENIVEIPAVWVDVDFKQIDEPDAQKRIDEFPFKPTVIVSSGGGLHCYWKLKEPAEKSDTEQAEAVMRAIAMQLGGDMACTDASRILRIPNTQNHKYKPPRKVFIKHQNGSTYNLSDFEDLLPVVVSSKETTPTSQPSDQLEAVMQCKFMQHCRDDAAMLSELEWYCMISNLVRVAGGRAKIHELSKPYPKYKARETDQKILHAIDASNPHTCQKIRELWDCGGDCGVKSPAVLRKRIQSNHDVIDVIDAGDADDASCRQRDANVTPTEKHLSDEVRTWLESASGSFSYQDVARDLQLYSIKPVLKSTQAIKNLARILQRLTDQGVLERLGVRTGTYRVRDTTCNKLDWQTASSSEYPIALPLGLSDMLMVHPKNIIVVAGDRNSAKTAFLLNVAAMNLGSLECHFFSSEMGPEEFRDRIDSFITNTPYPTTIWNELNVWDRDKDFHDVVYPNALNIIDFLELEDDFYRVNEKIAKIWRRLERGVAVIGLQKKMGAEHGRGGDFGAEKARLYLTFSLDETPEGVTNIGKILKGKRYRGDNCNGWTTRFKAVKGSRLVQLGGWGYAGNKREQHSNPRY